MERTSAVGYKENDLDEHAVGELADDAKDAAIKYQVSSNLLVTVGMHC
jgi:hypothetical protein